MKKIILAALFLCLVAGVYGVGYSEDGSGFATFGGTRMCMADGSVPITGTWDFSNATVSGINNFSVVSSSMTTSEIQSMLDLGGIITFIDGDYSITNLNLSDNSIIDFGTSRFLLPNNAATYIFGGNNVRNVTVRGGFFDGNYDGQTDDQHPIIYFENSQYVNVYDMKIDNARGRGLFFNQTNFHVNVENVYVEANLIPFAIADVYYGNFNNLYATNASEYGYVISSISSNYNNLISEDNEQGLEIAYSANFNNINNYQSLDDTYGILIRHGQNINFNNVQIRRANKCILAPSWASDEAKSNINFVNTFCENTTSNAVEIYADETNNFNFYGGKFENVGINGFVFITSSYNNGSKFVVDGFNFENINTVGDSYAYVIRSSMNETIIRNNIFNTVNQVRYAVRLDGDNYAYYNNIENDLNYNLGLSSISGTSNQIMRYFNNISLDYLQSTYIGGQAYVCVNDAGDIFASETVC